MEAPKCKLCGERHYGMCAQSNKPAKKPTTRPVEKIAAQSSTSERIDAPPLHVNPPPYASTLPVNCPHCGRPMLKTDDKAAYQRDYMRKRRARQKARE
jgi:hypothetical protein